eukprot:TRINITY_DN23082_c0_g1_i1.p1 TRINITY_DN23082_c0_g1~~TRINITY_DN23082_c0_g1_i1.p1  ORF type:complete len:339 (-),score=90.62 TRINITY_DN23082_c0_g1_i1:30-1046(-)
MEKGRVIGVCFGFLLAIPAVFIRLIVRFINLGCAVFRVKTRTQPACLLDPELGVHKYMSVNGTKIHYVEAGDFDKPLMLFVHGFPEFWFSWRHQIKHFKKNYRVVAMDTRGYNESDKPAGIEEYILKNLVEDVKGLVEGLGVSKFTLVAHDWGGAIAWNMAAIYPEMVDNLIICNLPHVLALEDAQKSSWSQMLKSWYMVFFQCPVLPELFTLMEDIKIMNGNMKDAKEEDKEVLEAYKYAFRDFTTWNRGINYYRAALTNKGLEFAKSIKGRLSSIEVRTLHIFGTGDKYLGLDSAQASAKYVKNYQLELLDGVSHWVQQEAHEQVNALMDTFLQKS